MFRDRSVADETAMDEDWLRVLDQYGVQILVLEFHGDRDLVTLLRSQAGWKVDFEDGEAVLFVREDSTQLHKRPICAHRQDGTTAVKGFVKVAFWRCW